MTTTTERRSAAHLPHDHEQRLAAKAALKFPPVRFTGIQARAVGRGFAEYLQKSQIKVWACAILPEHVHLVTGKLPIKAEQLIIQLKGAATRRLVAEDLHPLRQFPTKKNRPPRCFARGEWKVYLDFDDILRAIRYVEQNPLKERKPRQNWDFVTPYFA